MRQYALSDARASCRLKKLEKLFLSPRCDACLWPRTPKAESGLQEHPLAGGPGPIGAGLCLPSV